MSKNALVSFQPLTVVVAVSTFNWPTLAQSMTRTSSYGYSLAFFLNTDDLLIFTSLQLYHSSSCILPRILFTYLPTLLTSPQVEFCQPWICCSLSYWWRLCIRCGSVSVSTRVHWILLWSKFARIYPQCILSSCIIFFNNQF